jgi:hypothetical protein
VVEWNIFLQGEFAGAVRHCLDAEIGVGSFSRAEIGVRVTAADTGRCGKLTSKCGVVRMSFFVEFYSSTRADRRSKRMPRACHPDVISLRSEPKSDRRRRMAVSPRFDWRKWSVEECLRFAVHDISSKFDSDRGLRQKTYPGSMSFLVHLTA